MIKLTSNFKNSQFYSVNNQIIPISENIFNHPIDRSALYPPNKRKQKENIRRIGNKHSKKRRIPRPK